MDGILGTSRHVVGFALREAVRTSRRWQTWVLRSAVCGAILGAVLYRLSHEHLATIIDQTSANELGRDLFDAYAAAQLALAALLASTLVASAVAEGRDAAGADLLVLTRVGPANILWGRVLSRLVAIGTLFLATAPALVLVMLFGGVGPWEVGNLYANTLVVIAVSACVGLLVTVLVDAPFFAMACMMGWVVLVGLVLPPAFELFVGLGRGPAAWLSPLQAAHSGTSEGLLPLLAGLPVIAVTARWSTQLFAERAIERQARWGEHDRGLGRWRIEAAVLSLAAMVALGIAELRLVLLSQGRAWPVAVEPAYVGALVVIVGSYALMLLALDAVTRFTRDVEGLTAGWSWRRALLTRAGLRGHVVGPPVVWREVLTRGSGSTATLSLWLMPVWWLGAAALARGFLSGDDWQFSFFLVGAFAGGLLAVAIATESITTEVRRDTLELLLLTRESAESVLAGKLIGVVVRAGPHLALAWGVGAVWAFWISSLSGYSTCASAIVAPGWNGLTVGMTLAWLFSSHFAAVLAAMLVALWLRPTFLSWAVNLAAAASVPFVSFAMFFWLPEVVRGLVLPLTEGYLAAGCGTSPLLFVSTAIYGMATLTLGELCRLSFRA